jgi:hypothetical protein
VKYALISDIHANPALQAVLQDIGRHKEVSATFHFDDLPH